jgi:uncharacterized membrane protein (DUF4010 family)
MLAIAAALRNWLGEAGVALGAVVAGFVDTHSAAKIAMAIGADSRGFALRVTPGLIAPMAAWAFAAPAVLR